MKRLSWEMKLGIILILASAAIYFIHYAIFRDAHHIFVYMIGEIAFLPVEVLLVTLIIHRLLEEQKKHERFEKLNMVIGAFFSEVGTKLLTYFSDYDPELSKLRQYLLVDKNWSENDFVAIRQKIQNHEYIIEIDKMDLDSLRSLLVNKRNFMVNLVENPTLLEHERFTQLLMAAFHLTEELDFREDVLHLPDPDRIHISGDITRAYGLLANQWLEYVRYLKDNYPFLFSLAIRVNPFDQNASPIIQG